MDYILTTTLILNNLKRVILSAKLRLSILFNELQRGVCTTCLLTSASGYSKITGDVKRTNTVLFCWICDKDLS